MVSGKGKRKILYNDTIFFWFIRNDSFGTPKVHILSEDKKINLEYPLFDTETSTTKKEIEKVLYLYFHSDDA